MEKKDWLELCWKYFDRHADQRISYFNFFVVFSTILTSGAITVLQGSVDLRYTAIPIGIVQIFVGYMFLKIDQRNKFLTNHAENAIKDFEQKNGNTGDQYTFLFNREDELTIDHRASDKKKFFPLRLISHGQAYKIIYVSFMIWGCLEVFAPLLVSKPKPEALEATLNIRVTSIDSLRNEIKVRDSLVHHLVKNIKVLNKQVEELKLIYGKYQLNVDTSKVLK